MKSVEYDIRYLQAGLEVLEEYLLAEDIFWPVGVKPPPGESSYPHLTLDWLLLARARLMNRQMSAEQEAQVQRLVTELDAYRTKWRVAWEKKARQCFHVRARMLGEFLQEYRESPADNADRYPYEVRLRTMLELLKPEIGADSQAELDLLRGLDGALRGMLEPGAFVWESELEAGFPKSRYWFLYGRLPVREKTG